MHQAACNYDASANVDDGSCTELDACGDCGGEGVSGCTAPEACNYNPMASCDDGSCIYPPVIDLGDDIETCEESVLLDAGPGFGSYLWSTGDTTQTIEVSESGQYDFTVAASSVEDAYSLSILPTEGDNHLVVSGTASSALDVSSTNRLTYSAWLKPLSLDNHSFVLHHAGEIPGQGQYSLQVMEGKAYFTSAGGANWPGSFESNGFIVSNSDLIIGEWNHVTLHYDGQAMRIFLNGALDFEVYVEDEFPVTYIVPNQFAGLSVTGEFFLGSNNAGGQRFNGDLDDVSVWNRALTDAEIQALYLCKENLPVDGLVGHWSFDEGSGNVIVDESGNGSDLTLHDATRNLESLLSDCTGQCSSSATIAVNILGQGCTAPEACNYNPTASCDDGSCIYPPVIDLGDDIETCEDSVLLDAGPGFDSYLWSTGDTSQVILAESSGTYLVDAEVLSDWTWVTGEPLLLDYWTSDQSTLNGGCAEMYSSDGFHIAPCNEQKHFVMEIDGLAIEEESFSLPEIEGFTYIDPSFMNDCNAGLNQVLTSAYFMSDVEATFGEAQQISESQGGHLVAISSPYENDFVANIDGCLFGCGNNCEGFWIGLERMICAAQDSISVVFEMKGCTDPDACNFDEEAVCDDGNCATCEALQEACGPGTSWDSEISQCVIEEQGACGPGTIWNPETSQCVIEESCGWNPDSDDDSLVGVSDLLMFLSVFGSEWPVFNCGDLVLHQGYEYETVQIGEQCWFAENLNNSSAGGGDIIEIQSHDDWLSNYELGMPGFCYPDFSEEHAQQYGKLYNIHAILSSDLCPNNWHVSTDEDWFVLEMFLGLPLEALTSEARLAYDIGYDLKDDAVWNGNNSSGFGAVPAGEKSGYDFPFSVGLKASFLTTTQPQGFSSYVGRVLNEEGFVERGYLFERGGYSIRCIKDTE